MSYEYIFGLLFSEEISRLEAELQQLREDADRHNVSHPDTIDVTNSNNIANHVDHTASNHLRQEIDRLKGNKILYSLVNICLSFHSMVWIFYLFCKFRQVRTLYCWI